MSLATRRIASLLFASALVAAGAARASLGDGQASVAADQARLRGTLRTTRAAAYTMHEIQAASGVQVHEYVAPSGSVFAVSWQGPFLPDMKQLLGPWFDEYARQMHAKRRRGPVSIQTPDLVVEMTGHARWRAGRAYVPSLVPAGVAPAEIE
jgi:hypothetical protein